MTAWLRVDFRKLVEEVCQPQVGQADLSIFGGQCTESYLLKFLEQWDLAGMPFRVWEYASEVVFKKCTLPQNIVLLERGRIFGEGGDLMLRRNGTTFGWRFIGPASIKPPAGEYGMQDYWKNHPKVMFHQYNGTALLWGKWNGERWVEDRVAAAKLDYPAIGQRIQLHYRVFSRAGQVEFVWYTGLSEWKEANHGKGND